jgi:hypothetical protein
MSRQRQLQTPMQKMALKCGNDKRKIKYSTVVQYSVTGKEAVNKNL